jgi:hypothetical protein
MDPKNAYVWTEIRKVIDHDIRDVERAVKAADQQKAIQIGRRGGIKSTQSLGACGELARTNYRTRRFSACTEEVVFTLLNRR